MTRYLSKHRAKALINGTKGKIFKVLFDKVNGDERIMICRTGVGRYVTGVGMSWDPEERWYKVVFDFQKQEYRMINLKKIKAFQCGRKVAYV